MSADVRCEMKSFAAILAVLCFGLVNCATMDMTGKKYVGKPVKTAVKPGNEGAGNPGQVSFDKERVSFVLPGSDEKNNGTYKVSGDTITVTDLNGKTHVFKLKEEGKVLQAGSDDLRRSDYPW